MRLRLPLNRTISAWLTPRLARWGFSPNQVTLLSLAIGLWGATCFAKGTAFCWIAGALAIELSYILDNCDGELARLTGKVSPLGCWLDIVSDCLIHMGLFLGIGAGWAKVQSDPRWIGLSWATALGVLLTYVTHVWEQVEARGKAAWVHPDPPFSEQVQGTIQRLKEIFRGDFTLVLIGSALVGRMGWLVWAGLIGSVFYWVPFAMRLLIQALSRPPVRLAIGVGIFLWLLTQVDLAAVWREVRAFHWRFGLIFFFYGLVLWLDTLGWRYAFHPNQRGKVRWDRLFRTRLAGEAVNYITPVAGIGGEPIKAVLLSRRYGVPLAQGVASVVVAKTTLVASMLLFVATGLTLTLFAPPLPKEVSRWVWVTFPTLMLLVALFFVVQFLRPFASGASFFRRIFPKGVMGLGMRRWDSAIVTFYRKAPRSLISSLGFHFLGWLAGCVEVFLILKFLHIPVTLLQACTIEALWVLLRSGAFLIPASLGASEGFALLICVGLGMSAVSGFALGLIRRAREILWMGLGLLEFSRG